MKERISFVPENDKKEVEINYLDLSGIDTMDAESLRKLIRTTAAVAKLVPMALLTKDEAYGAVCLKLLEGGMKQDDINKALPALQEWANRTKGKPVQAVESNVRVSINDGKHLGLTMEQRMRGMYLISHEYYRDNPMLIPPTIEPVTIENQ